MKYRDSFKFCKIMDVKSPQRGTEDAAGLDLFIPNNAGYIIIKPGESLCINAGIKVCLDKWTCGLIVNKSSMGKLGLVVGAQLIDSDYRGPIHINVWNVSNKDILLEEGQKLVQMIIMDYHDHSPKEIDETEFGALPPTSRGEGGFGSTSLH